MSSTPEPGPRVALVTGAASPNGIGAACARALAAAGCAVGLLDHRPCDAVGEELSAAGARAIALRADLRRDDEIDAAVTRLEAELGTCSILVNCAADLTLGTLAETDRETLGRVLEVNVEASVMLTRRVAPGMAENGWGRIVNIASDTFDRPPGPGMLAYVTSKGAIVGMTRALAVELGPHGITVNALSPGLTRTANTDANQAGPEFEAVREAQAVKRTLFPDDYAATLTFLVSDGAAIITGQTIRADAGLAMG